MKNVEFYQEDCFEFHKYVINRKRNTKDDPNYQNRVTTLNPQIENLYATYKEAFENRQLEALVAYGYTGQEKDDLLSLYAFKRVALQTLLTTLTTNKRKRKKGICANCTLSEINSFDHILPKEEFAEFVVNPLNLVPSCTNCNSRKWERWIEDGRRLFLNLYMDKIPASQFLYAAADVKSEDDITITFELKNPGDISEDLYELIVSHYEELELISRFSENVDDVVTDLINYIKPYLDKVHRAGIEEATKEYISESQRIYGLNNWKCVVQAALIDNPNFLNLFNYKLG